MAQSNKTTLLLAIFCATLLPGHSSALAEGFGCDHVQNCELQTQAPVHYYAWDTKGWAYYCTGDHPYFWGMNQSGLPFNYSWHNSCFTVSENIAEENAPNKADFFSTNWCLKGENLIVSLACSTNPPPGVGFCSNTVGGPVKDPGCPQSDVHNYCNPNVPFVECFQTFGETCGNGTQYTCSTDVDVTWCLKCQ
jgi:hypothetical protein